MGLLLGIGVIAGTVTFIGHLLVVLLPYIILAAAVSEKDKKKY